ncbi:MULTISPECIES: L,D-transpeptidase family protein [Pacificimonas]|uniref:L,D-transpeptidase family protein n=1 Tax=Pacificimonas TaxID=1960290 RepID=UPI001CCACF57|nr:MULTISPECIES: L,D-transpeptidase family protein [Pacificimonas]
MSHLLVSVASQMLVGGDISVPCLIGAAGGIPASEKREGDRATPLGTYRLSTVLMRPDRVVPPPGIALPWRWTAKADGWSDDPEDPAYNRPVRHPHRHSAERMWRDDGLYDIVVTLSHNTPAIPGAGSAVFLHCTAAKPHTAGCVAVERGALLTLLPLLAAESYLSIV